jgi:hypothetical protein
MTTAPAPTTRARAFAAFGLYYVAICFGLSYFLPAYEVKAATSSHKDLLLFMGQRQNQRVQIVGWQAPWLATKLLFSGRLGTLQSCLVTWMLLANLFLGIGFALGLANRWRGAAALGFGALGGASSCLLHPWFRLDEFAVGYYVWLASTVLLVVVAVYQFRVRMAQPDT